MFDCSRFAASQRVRDLYVRHREQCKKAKKGNKKKPPRQIFGCGCPIYARYEIRDLVTGSVLERFNGSLQGHYNERSCGGIFRQPFLKCALWSDSR